MRGTVICLAWWGLGLWLWWPVLRWGWDRRDRIADWLLRVFDTPTDGRPL